MSQNARVAMWVPTATPADVEAVISTTGPPVDGVLPTGFEELGDAATGPAGPQGPQGVPGVTGPPGPTGPQGIVEDAPDDGIIYGRSDAAWVPVATEGGGGVPSDTDPLMDGVAAPGVLTTYARGDHKHPSDTAKADVSALALKAPLASPALTGAPTAPTAAADTNTTQIATTAYVDRAVSLTGETPSNAAPLMDGVAAAGTSDLYARGDHIHPSDTAKANVTHTHAQGDITNLTTDLTARVLKAGDTMTGALVLPAGTLALPAIKFGDASTGLFRRAANQIGLSCNSFEVMSWSSNGTASFYGGIKGNDGGATAPSYTFTSQNNTGFYYAASTLYWTIVGTQKLSLSATVMTSAVPIALPADPASNLHAATKQYVDGKAAPAAATAAEYRANSAPTKMLTSGATWDAAAYVSLAAVGSAHNFDFSLGIDFSIAFSSATHSIPDPTNAKPGQKGLIYVTAGAGAAVTSWGTAWKFPGGIKPAFTANGTAPDVISYWVLTPTIIICTFAADFK
jgi:hypothetical protein